MPHWMVANLKVAKKKEHPCIFAILIKWDVWKAHARIIKQKWLQSVKNIFINIYVCAHWQEMQLSQN